jgi:hypothetical protein
MIKGSLINDIKTRRKSSMLQGLYNIKYFLVLAILLVLPMMAVPSQANGNFGRSITDQTDSGAFRVIYYVDTRDRDTYIQVTNTSDRAINIHVQILDSDFDLVQFFCSECNFDDMLTAKDTHVYNVKEMFLNKGPGLTPEEDVQCQFPDNKFGFVAISFDGYKDGLGICGTGPDSDCKVVGGPLIGMFRIIDESGYEYRTNAAGKAVNDLCDNTGSCGYVKWGKVRNPDLLVNFNLGNGNNLSDLVGITYLEVSGSRILASPFIATSFGFFDEPILIYNEKEKPISCGEQFFSCSDSFAGMNKGIDNSLPNSKGHVPPVCTTSRITDTNHAGWLHMPFTGFVCLAASCGSFGNDVFFTGFRGLNNGDGTGVMDSWWAVPARHYYYSSDI